jgi:hypothetical protein
VIDQDIVGPLMRQAANIGRLHAKKGEPMKKLCLLLLPVLFASLVQSHPTQVNPSIQIMQPGQGCTVIYAASSSLALAGNNEDSFNPLTRIWFIPASDGQHGRVYFGYDDLLPQGGLNDQGLFFDGLSVPYEALVTSPQKPDFPGGPLAMIDEVMARSATVEEALNFFDRYRRLGLETGQLFFGDTTGNSAIVEGNATLRKQGSYQIATNFRQSENPDPPYPDDRYTTADERLSQAGSYSPELFRQILDATHQDHYVQTVYSQVYDLKQGLIYLYLFHDYDHSVVLNLADELAKGPHTASLGSLFLRNPNYEAWSSEQTEQWRLLYAYRIDSELKPASLRSLAGEYQLESDDSALPARVYLEKDQLYLQTSNELPLELYPTSVDSVFHPFYNNSELQLTFERNLLGQVTGAQGKQVYNGNEILNNYHLKKVGLSYGSQIAWLALLIVLVLLTVLVFVIRRRRAR